MDTALDEPEQLMATLGMIEKAVCSIKKITETNVENKELEDVVNDTLEVLVVFKDRMVKRRTVYDQEKWPKKSTVNLITDIKNMVCINKVLLFVVYYRSLFIMVVISNCKYFKSHLSISIFNYTFML